jgi:hypothetical protein
VGGGKQQAIEKARKSGKNCRNNRPEQGNNRESRQTQRKMMWLSFPLARPFDGFGIIDADQGRV